MGVPKIYLVLKKFSARQKYDLTLKKQQIHILKMLQPGQEVTISDLVKNIPSGAMRTRKAQTMSENVGRALRVAKEIGLVQEKLLTRQTLQEFRQLETIQMLKNSLNSSNLINSSDSEKLSKTFKSYTEDLWHFDNWLFGKTIKLVQEKPLESGGYDKTISEITIEGLEHFLELYRDVPSMKESTKFVRICLEYLHRDELKKYSWSKVNNIKFAIQSYFKYNLAPLEITFNAKNNFATIADEQREQFYLTMDELFRILTQGRPTPLQKAVILCKFQRGLDDATFADRFNHIIYDKLVEFFGTEQFERWDLTQCPMPLWLTRVKTSYYHLGFLDVDAIRAVQDYLRYRRQKGNPAIPGQPLFLTTKGKPVSRSWVLTTLPSLAKRAGVQKAVEFYKTGIKRNTKTSHEMRDLLKSIMVNQGIADWRCEMFIGHKVGDSYEKQAKLYPEDQKREYMKISKLINLFSRVSQKLNESDNAELLKFELSERKQEMKRIADEAVLDKLDASIDLRIQKITNEYLEKKLKELLDQKKHDDK